MDFSKFEKKIEVEFKDKDLLKKAFTHRSYINEHGGSYWDHNDRLEYLGDAVLELVVSRHLYDKFPEEKEGILTSYRSALVNTITISDSARNLDMNSYLLLSKGESKDTGRARNSILANAFEALIGAIYLDQGYDTAEQFIANNLFHLTDNVIKNRSWQDSKSFFQEKAQDIVKITPSYQVLDETGPDHDRKFKIGAFLGEDQAGEGVGASKQIAEQEAAKDALKNKNWNN